MTQHMESTPDERDATIEPPVPPDLGYPGMGYGDDKPLEQGPLTFTEMLPAARAFYRRSKT